MGFWHEFTTNNLMLGVSEHVVRTNMANRFNWLDDEQPPISMGWNGVPDDINQSCNILNALQVGHLASCRFPTSCSQFWAAMNIASQVACQCHATANLAGEACLFAGTAPWNSMESLHESPFPWQRPARHLTSSEAPKRWGTWHFYSPNIFVYSFEFWVNLNT